MAATKISSTETAPVEELQPVLGERLALNWKHVLLCGWFAAFFLYLNYVPLFHSDIWGHVLYGHWILEHGTLPTEDPFLPLAAGVRVIDTAWLSQLVFGWVDQLGGPQFLSNLFAVTVLCSYLIQTRVFYLFSRSIGLSLAGMAFSFFVGYSRHAIIRPEIFGVLCFSLLLWLIVRLEPWRSRARGFARPGHPDGKFPLWIWLAVPALFALWANLHGSFAVGLVVLACHALGRILEVAWTHRSLRAICSDRQVRSWVVLTELALAATLINPYGLDLLIETARFGRNPNLKDVMEWYPLRFIDLEGIQFAIGLVAAMFLLRQSRQRMRAADVLMLILFGAAMAPAIRMIAWFALVLAFALMPHLSDVVRRARVTRAWSRRPARGSLAVERTRGQAVPNDDNPEAGHEGAGQYELESGAAPARPKFALTLFCLLILWCAFALSPISQPVLGGKPREDEQMYSRHTPLQLTAYLRANPPDDLIFAPQWWGEWVLRDGPPDMKVFMTTNVHLAPSRVWRDYLIVARGESGWEATLDRYSIRTLVAHKELQGQLTRVVRRSNDWEIIYEDQDGIVARKRGQA